MRVIAGRAPRTGFSRPHGTAGRGRKIPFWTKAGTARRGAAATERKAVRGGDLEHIRGVGKCDTATPNRRAQRRGLGDAKGTMMAGYVPEGETSPEMMREMAAPPSCPDVAARAIEAAEPGVNPVEFPGVYDLRPGGRAAPGGGRLVRVSGELAEGVVPDYRRLRPLPRAVACGSAGVLRFRG